jgi:transcriptional regulator with XRE-family HTH domain
MDNLSSEIAELARQGLSLPQIAERLGVSESQIAAELDSHAPAPDDRRDPDEASADSFPASDPPPGPAAP